jgi:hypothetical protein
MAIEQIGSGRTIIQIDTETHLITIGDLDGVGDGQFLRVNDEAGRSETLNLHVSGHLHVTQNLVLNNDNAPESATSKGVRGTISWDGSYLYVCVADNTWKRTSMSTW